MHFKVEMVRGLEHRVEIHWQVGDGDLEGQELEAEEVHHLTASEVEVGGGGEEQTDSSRGDVSTSEELFQRVGLLEGAEAEHEDGLRLEQTQGSAQSVPVPVEAEHVLGVGGDAAAPQRLGEGDVQESRRPRLGEEVGVGLPQKIREGWVGGSHGNRQGTQPAMCIRG